MNYLALKIPGPSGAIEVKAPTGIPTGGDKALEFALKNGLIIFLILILVIATFVLIFAGIQWITSGGDKSGIDKAKHQITYAIIGIIIALGAFFIVNVVGGLFNLTLFP